MGPFLSEYIQAILTLVMAMFIALAAHFARAVTPEELNKINVVVENHELDPKKVEETAEWLESLEKKSATDDAIKAQLSRTYFFIAVDEPDPATRIKKWQKAIDKADDALKLNKENIVAHFWKAAAIGKQGLDMGVTKALKNAKPMKEHLEKVLLKDPGYEKGSAQRALGRLYYKVPGWPLSFRDNEKSKQYLTKAVELAPLHLGNRAFLAETLVRLGNRDEAKKHVEFVLSAPEDPKHKKENQEFIQIAKELKKDL